MRGVRRNDNPRLRNPEQGEDFVLPDFYKQPQTGAPFYSYDTQQKRNRMLLFGTAENLQLLRNDRDWFADGTFKPCPRAFHQIFNLYSLSNGRGAPLVFGLLPNETRATYNEVLDTLLRLKPDLNSSI